MAERCGLRRDLPPGGGRSLNTVGLRRRRPLPRYGTLQLQPWRQPREVLPLLVSRLPAFLRALDGQLMAWTTPAAWNTGVVKDAAFWNAQVKANLEFLYGAPACRVYNSANESILDSTATA